MHRTAEFGIAAHWKYKLGKGGKDSLDAGLAWIHRMLETGEESIRLRIWLQILRAIYRLKKYMFSLLRAILKACRPVQPLLILRMLFIQRLEIKWLVLR